MNKGPEILGDSLLSRGVKCAKCCRRGSPGGVRKSRRFVPRPWDLRKHELAVPAALGAGRWQLVRQSLTESTLVAVIGGGLGVAIAVWGMNVFSRLLSGSPEGLHYNVQLDLKVLGFALAVSLITALLSGILPAMRAAAVDPRDGLNARATVGIERHRSGRFLVAAQIALSLLLLAGAGLYVRTLVNLTENP
jgi:predicted lysophospholipase L1 biosynthesis ABC-type transport system permease subunit